MRETIRFDDDQMKIRVEGWEYEDDEGSDDPQGDNFYEIYRANEIKDAMRDFLELDDRGWNPEMFIQTGGSKGLSMNIRMNDILSLWSYFDGEELNGVHLDKFERIKAIINE